MATHRVPTVDGFTPEQQFFLAWAQFRGEAVRIETQRQIVKDDPHAVPKFRVIGPLSNLPAFEHAFSCKPGAPMVRPPEQRCAVW
jgi:endothelin-converting enzyme/putative endopeptidase